MHPCHGPRSTLLADILFNTHVMHSPVRKLIVKSRAYKLEPEAHWTSWLPLCAINGDKWAPWLWGVTAFAKVWGCQARWSPPGGPGTLRSMHCTCPLYRPSVGPVLSLGCTQVH